MMRLLALVPLVVLLALAAVGWLALREPPPLEFGFWRPPRSEPLAPPVLPLGDAVARGRVVDPGGAPVPRALVGAVDRGRLAWTRTGADGAFELEEVTRDTLQVSVVAAGFVPRHAEVVADAPNEIRLERVPRPPRLPDLAWSDLTGRVEGVPGPGYELAFEPAAAPEELGGAVPRRVAVDASGRFVLPRLAHGAYLLRLLPPWARGANTPDLLTRLDAPPTRYVHPSSEPRLALSFGAGEIQGRMRATGPGRFEYVEGALVLVTARRDGEEPSVLRWPPVATDAEGAFLVTDLPPGEYDVSIVAGREAIERHVTVHPGATTRLDL